MAHVALLSEVRAVEGTGRRPSQEQDGRYDGYDGGRFHRTVTPENQPDEKVMIDVIQAGVPPVRIDRARLLPASGTRPGK